MEAAVQPARKRWTYEEYARLDDNRRYEIIGGDLLAAPAPELRQRRLTRQLFLAVDRRVKRGKLGEVHFAPVDVILDISNVVQPDLVFVSKDRVRLLKKEGIQGSPDLVAEIVFGPTAEHNRQIKKTLYERFGVKEYWLVDPAKASFEVFALRDGQYQPLCSAVERGKIHSEVLPGFILEILGMFPSGPA